MMRNLALTGGRPRNGEAVKTREDHKTFLDGSCAHGYTEAEEYTGTGKPGHCHDGCHPPDGYATTKINYGDRAELGRAFEVAFAEDRLTFVGPEMMLNPAFDPADLASVFSFTALREPRARLVSQYHQKLNYNPDFGRTVGLEGTPAFQECYASVKKPHFCNHLVTLADFLRWMKDGGGTGGGFNDNYMARYLLGLNLKRFHGVRRPLDAADLAAAKAVLRDKMNFVLITERLDEAGCLLERLGWSPAADRANVKVYDDVKDDLAADPEVEALLDELTTVDEELYPYAVELFEEQLGACAGCRCALSR